jgi:hypothetical protein
VYMSVFVSIHRYMCVYCVCACMSVYLHNEFIYIYINSNLDYLRFKLINLINPNNKILT